MPTTSGGIAKATDFELDALILMGASGRSVDLRLVMQELNLFEDLFANVMSGTVVINDTQDIINKLGVVGDTHLIVAFSKPSIPLKLSKVFRVYKFTDRKRSGSFSEHYILHFCSEELLLDQSVRISKAYKGRSISQMVTDIARTHLGITTVKLPPKRISDTTENFDVVVPLWTPFYTINWLSRIATTGKDKGCSFLFFEHSQGFQFQSIEALSQQKPVQELNYMPANFRGEENPQKSDLQQRFESIESFEILDGPDILRSIPAGMYAGNLTRVNTMDQKITTLSVGGDVMFNTTRHLEPYSIFSRAKDRSATRQTEHYGSSARVRHDSMSVDKWLLQRNAYLTGIHAFRIRVVVPGHLGLQVGQVLKVNLPAAIKNDKKGVLPDALYAGNYLITTVMHKLDREKYVCILELSKDAIQDKLSPALQDNPGLIQLRKL